MPAVSMFFGIIVMMHCEIGAPHHVPHLHARCGEHRAAVDFDGNVIGGSLPPKKLTLLRAWIVLHRDEIEANWDLLSEGADAFKIEPLK